MLPSLYQTLKDQPRHHTYKFVAFAQEKKGLLGSRKFVQEETEEQAARLNAFVNLECLGMTPPKVWLHRSTPILVSRLIEIAKATKIPLVAVNVEQVGDDDTHPFWEKRFRSSPFIHSSNRETFAILHSNGDVIEVINLDTDRLVAFYLVYLDDNLPNKA